jgi:hypothetical protein
MKHRNSHFAVGYWSRLRKGKGAPDQADIDPKALKRLLPFVFLLDARSGDKLIYRLAGTTLCERYGGELRGRDFLCHWDPNSRSWLIETLRQALAKGAPACLTSVGATEDCGMVEIETVLMPIRFGAGEPERFLGVAQVLTDVAPLAGRYISFERLVSVALVEEGESATINAPTSPPPDNGRRNARAPHLRLVASRDSASDNSLNFDASEAIGRLLNLGRAAFERCPDSLS